MALRFLVGQLAMQAVHQREQLARQFEQLIEVLFTFQFFSLLLDFSVERAPGVVLPGFQFFNIQFHNSAIFEF